MLDKIQGVWEFASAQRKIILDKADDAGSVERQCLIFTSNCIADIMDELADILENSDKINKPCR